MVNHFASSFAPYFLVIHGGTHPWHQLPGWGHFFWSEYIAIVLGIVIALKTILVKRKEWLTVMTLRDGLENNSVGKKLSVFFLLLISLAPSVITVDAPHATRSLFFFVILMVFIGFCLEFFTETYKKIAISLVVLTSSYFFIAYLFSYFTQFPATQKIILWSGFDKTIQEVQSKYPKEKIAVVDPSGYQYILLAWYAHISPQQFFATVSKQLPDRIGFRYGEQVGRYHFIARSEDRSQTEKIVVEWKEGSWQIRDN